MSTFVIFPWLKLAQTFFSTVTPLVNSTDTSPTVLSPNEANAAFDTMSSRDLYSILFKTVPPVSGTSGPTMYDPGTYPWPNSLGGEFESPFGGSGWH